MEQTAKKLAQAVEGGDEAAGPGSWRAVAAWILHLARTLKTCRLYDGENPTVIRFREDLARGLEQLLKELAPLRLEITSDDIRWQEHSLYPARSREDNLAHPFFRDGIRGLSFHAGVEPQELESFVDQVLRVTGPRGSDEDLVTLLWDAHLPHIEIDYVPTDGDIDGGGDPGRQEAAGPVVPWPGEGVPNAPPPPAAASAAAAPQAGALPPAAGSSLVAPEGTGRSDDWETREGPADPLRLFGVLEMKMPGETRRFASEMEEDRQRSLVASSLGLMQDCLGIESSLEERRDLMRFLPRVLRETILQASWSEAEEVLGLLEKHGPPEWSIKVLIQELSGPYSVVTPRAVTALDRQDGRGVEAFLAFARRLGGDAVDWLMSVLAASQQKRVRRPLTRVIAELCGEDAGKLRPWLDDQRWFVVRNVIHILGWIGGNRVVPLLQQAIDHPEPRVRQEVVAALAQVDAGLSRPILLRMMEDAPPRLMAAILHQLSQERDPAAARRILDIILSPGMEKRSAEEARSLYMALGGCGGPEILPELEAELNRGSWLALSPDPHRRAVARCLARMGLPESMEVLQRGVRSRRPAVHRACQEALAGSGSDA